MTKVVCYQYFQFGKCVWLKNLYERPQYAMDCVVKWRIKEKSIIEKLIELEHIMYKHKYEKYKNYLNDENISYWVENKTLKKEEGENEQWRYM